MDWGSLIGGAGSLLGGITSSIFSHSAMKRQLKAQAEENQKNRDFNAEQARLAQQYNSRMVNEQNQYDSPSAQMDRLQQAGLNPNLVYGQMGNASVGVGSTSMQGSSSGSVGSGLPDYSGILQGVLGISKMAMEFAQGRKSDSDVKVNSASIDEKAANTKFIISRTKLTEEETNKVTQSIENLKQVYKNLEQQCLLLQKENDIKHEQWTDLLNYVQRKHELARQGHDPWGAAVREVMATAKCKEAEAQFAVQLALANLRLVQSNTSLNNSSKALNDELKENAKKLGINLGFDNELKEFTLDIDKEYYELEKTMGLIKDGCTAVSSVLGAAIKAFLAAKGSKTPDVVPADVAPVRM